MHHILVNCDHIHSGNIAQITTENTHIWLFLSVKQTSLSLDLVESLLPFGERVHFIYDNHEHDLNGVDFYLSFYVGKIIEIDHEATIIVISENKQNDFFLQHIKQSQTCKGIVRINQLEELPLIDYIQPLEDSDEPIFPDDFAYALEEEENNQTIFIAEDTEKQEKTHNLSSTHDTRYVTDHSPKDDEIDLEEDEEKKLEENMVSSYKASFSKENKNNITKKSEQHIISADLKKQIEEDEKFAEANLAADEAFNNLIVKILNNPKDFPDNYPDLEQEISKYYLPSWVKLLEQDMQNYIITLIFNKFLKKNFIKYKDSKIIYNITPESIYENIILRIQRRRPRTLQGLVDIIQNEANFIKLNHEKITDLLSYIENRQILVIENKNIFYPDETNCDVEKDYQQKKEEAFKLSLSAISSETGPKTKEKLKKQIAPYIRYFPDLTEEDLIKFYVENNYLTINNFGIVTYHNEHYQDAHESYSEAYNFIQENPYFKNHIELLEGLFEYFEESLSLLSCQVIIHLLKVKKCLSIKNNIVTYKF